MNKLQQEKLALEAITAALRARKEIGIDLCDAVSPIDAAQKLGVEVRLIDTPSMEGMYVSSGSPQIFLSVQRPAGRRNFTCAHELGHHKFNHGTQYDELLAQKSVARQRDPTEFTADCFSAFFMMPKTAIDSGLNKRGMSYASLTPNDVYALSNWLGVGYKTLISHLQFGTRAISRETAERLTQSKPQQIRQMLLGQAQFNNLHIVDSHWSGRPVDCEVGDVILTTRDVSFEGSGLSLLRCDGVKRVVEVMKPGINRLVSTSGHWSTFVRVARRSFTGRACYRFEEEPNEETVDSIAKF